MDYPKTVKRHKTCIRCGNVQLLMKTVQNEVEEWTFLAHAFGSRLCSDCWLNISVDELEKYATWRS